MFGRVVLLSATPDPEVKKILRDFFAPLEIDLFDGTALLVKELYFKNKRVNNY